MNRNRVFFAAVALVAIAAPAVAESGRPAPAELPAPPEGKGQIIFWRSGTMMGGAMGCGVNIGKERISALGAGKYFILNIEPGAHEFNGIHPVKAAPVSVSGHWV